MREGVDRRIEAEDWKEAALCACNLSELEVTLGRLGEAMANGRRAIDFAGRSGDAFEMMSDRARAADALHHAGERAEAGALSSREAERMKRSA